MAPGVLGIGTTAYISAHNQVKHTVWLPLEFHSRYLLDSCPCKSLPHLSKRLQPGAGWQVDQKIVKSTSFEFQGWGHPEYPLGGTRGSKRPNSCGGDSSGLTLFMSKNLQASETVMQFSLGWFAKPILVDGRYPEVLWGWALVCLLRKKIATTDLGDEDKSGCKKRSSRVPRVATSPIHCGWGDVGQQVLRLPWTQLLHKRIGQAGGWGHRRRLIPQVGNHISY